MFHPEGTIRGVPFTGSARPAGVIAYTEGPIIGTMPALRSRAAGMPPCVMRSPLAMRSSMFRWHTAHATVESAHTDGCQEPRCDRFAGG